MKLYVLSFLLLFIVPSCLADETKPPVFSWENPTTLYFKGNVSKDNFRLMQEELKKHKNSLETLIISSGGGETT
ncbi:hypothetical protein CA267_006635 [Alteromonas pelagimontana]|uniref:Alpha/beta hydrolase n=1 Tax=Alteromonas pelagimontana TaxID=1858656 RepID=A0A6M4MBA8_9ALTE|nr:hypothetical protein [Alteromonas pelagimontana]QJR80472.1 hypothetical protein CA267_006635 [Alteromonas pelagimontana]